MAAIRKAVGRAVLSSARSQRAGGDALHIGGVAQRTVRFYGHYGDASTAVIGGEHPFPGGIDTQVSGPPALRVDYVEELQAAVRLNRECRDRAVPCAAEIGDLVHRIQKLLIGRDCQ